MKPEIDEARLLATVIILHGFLASPIDFKPETIVKDAVELADRVFEELEKTTK